MRFIDIAVAALIGSSAITGIIVWSPKAGDVAARQLGTQVRRRDGLVDLLRRGGMVSLESPSAACALLAEASNSTFTLYATAGASSCGSPPKEGSPSATLSFRLVSFEVVLVAWSSG